MDNISLIIESTNINVIDSYVQNFREAAAIKSDPHPDLIIVDSEKSNVIGIKEIKTLIKWAKLKPFNSKMKLAVVKRAEFLSNEAQNAMLKILEEPNDFVKIVLVVNNRNNLLPTIISRCHLLTDSSQGSAAAEINMDKLSLLNTVEEIMLEKDARVQKNAIDELFNNLLSNYRKVLLSEKSNAIIENIRLIYSTKLKLQSSTSKKLLLENLIINLQ